MDYSQWVVALVSAVVSFVTAYFLIPKEMIVRKFASQMDKEVEHYRHELEQVARDEERRYRHDEIMKRYRAPLIHAVYELQSRIYNIVVKGFADKYGKNGNDGQREYAVKNTAYVIAQYFAWSEIIRNEVQLIEYDNPEETRRLSELRNKLYATWQTDDIQDGFMFWAGEQRAIGELMIEKTDSGAHCIGYAAFLEKFRNQAHPLLKTLEVRVEKMIGGEAACLSRLCRLHGLLIELLDLLDEDYRYFPKKVRGRIPEDSCNGASGLAAEINPATERRV